MSAPGGPGWLLAHAGQEVDLDLLPDATDVVTADGIVVHEEVGARAVFGDEVADPVRRCGFCPGDAWEFDAEGSLVGGDGVLLVVEEADV